METKVINLFDGNKAHKEVLKQCLKRSIDERFANEAADWAKKTLLKHGVRYKADVIRSAMNIATARQSTLDKENRLALKAVNFMGVGKK